MTVNKLTDALSTRDALAKALNRPLAGVIPTEWTAVEGSEFLLMVADALIASGAVVDVSTLADDEALVEAIAADQKEAADSWGEPLPGAERSMRARTALVALATALSERVR